MLNKEIKLLKYLKKHPHIPRSTLIRKFPFLDDAKINGYIYIDGQEEIMDGEYSTGTYRIIDSSTYFLSREGEIFLENLSRDKIKTYFTPIFVSIITNAVIFIGKVIINNFSAIIKFMQSIFNCAK